MGNNMIEKQESEYLYDKKFTCIVCNKEFTSKQVRIGKARFKGTDEILKPLYTGIDCTKYDVIMCPHCGYAAVQEYMESLRQSSEQHLKSRLKESFRSHGRLRITIHMMWR